MELKSEAAHRPDAGVGLPRKLQVYRLGQPVHSISGKNDWISEA